MLINISNHPVSEWSDKQIAEAKRLWGDIIDVSFPSISAQADKDEVVQLATANTGKYIEIIEQYNSPSAFHIMGEMVYCYNVIKFIKERGYTVVASTSNRQVESRDGKKIVTFSFERFREY